MALFPLLDCLTVFSTASHVCSFGICLLFFCAIYLVTSTYQMVLREQRECIFEIGGEGNLGPTRLR
jgi:hypothetical protein